MKRKLKIVQPGDEEAVQLGLFSAANSGDTAVFDDYPPIHTTEDGFRKVLAGVTDLCGLDFEFNIHTLRPTVLGISNDTECAAVFYTEELHRLLETERLKRGFKYSAYSGLTSDRQVHEKMLGPTGINGWSDSMLTFWMANADLAKAPTKEDDGDGGLGFMGLWTAASMYTMLPAWKTCRGRNCDEYVCPRHSVREYCAIDAYAGLIVDRKTRAELGVAAVPPETIRNLHTLQELTQKMQDKGVAVNHSYVKTLAKEMTADQQKIFAPQGEEGYVFNPRSPKEVIGWFRDRNIFLVSSDKDDVQSALEKYASKEGYDFSKFEELYHQLEEAEVLGSELDCLFRLYQYKILGKGTDSWFHPRYFRSDNRLHPRFVVTGTSTGRLSSSRPNANNVPKRGWGKKVRKAFVPDEGCMLVESDWSQLELRVCLYLAGVDPAIIGADAFSWLVSKSDGLFEKAAQRYGGKPRDIAKSISHGADYMEGIKLLEPAELSYSRYRSEIEAGALRVYHPKFNPDIEREWNFMGRIVAFTGSNLAQRIFGNKSHESRKKALEIQEDIYFKAFPQIRRWQQSVLDKCQDSRRVQAPNGRFLRLNDTAEKNAKLAVAFLGQGVGAIHAQSVMRQMYTADGIVANNLIHDALLWNVPRDNYKRAWELSKQMEMGSPDLPGFRCPAKAEVSNKSWGEMEELTMEEGRLKVGERFV